MFPFVVSIMTVFSIVSCEQPNKNSGVITRRERISFFMGIVKGSVGEEFIIGIVEDQVVVGCVSLIDYLSSQRFKAHTQMLLASFESPMGAP
jgi:hypothetical protein